MTDRPGVEISQPTFNMRSGDHIASSTTRTLGNGVFGITMLAFEDPYIHN